LFSFYRLAYPERAVAIETAAQPMPMELRNQPLWFLTVLDQPNEVLHGVGNERRIFRQGDNSAAWMSKRSGG
jgi:hypothetical protein